LTDFVFGATMAIVNLGLSEVIILATFVPLVLVVVALLGNRPRADRFFAVNDLEPRPADVGHVDAVLRGTRRSRVAGAVVGFVLGGLTGASLGGPGAIAGAGIGLLAGTMLGITLAQPRPEAPSAATRTASLSVRDPRDYLPRRARGITVGLAAVVIGSAVVAMVASVGPLDRTVAIFVVGMVTVIAVPVGRAFQRRTVELRRPDVDVESVRVDDALRASALRGIHHATIGVLMCGLLLVGYGTVSTQGVLGISVRGVTVVAAPPLSHGFGVDSPASATARRQRVHWIEASGSHHSTLVPTRLVQARDVTIGTIVDDPVLHGIGAWMGILGFFGALIEWGRAAKSWRRPQTTPTALGVAS
jgi:hypothetical protein